MTTIQHPETLPIIQAGTPIVQATGVLILLHGRGGSAEDMIGLGRALASDRLTLLAPQAPGHTWYPYSFLAPRQQMEPYLRLRLRKAKQRWQRPRAPGWQFPESRYAGFHRERVWERSSSHAMRSGMPGSWLSPVA